MNKLLLNLHKMMITSNFITCCAILQALQHYSRAYVLTALYPSNPYPIIFRNSSSVKIVTVPIFFAFSSLEPASAPTMR